MAQTALEPAEGVAPEPAPRPTSRRFELPDFTTHSWIFERIAQFCPHMHPLQIRTYLISQLYGPEFYFLYMPNAVGLAQVIRSTVFEPTPVIMERFILCQDPANEDHQLQAADFYDDLTRWARNQGATKLFVMQHSDVPLALVEKKFKRRMYEMQQMVADIGTKK